ncbi:MAG TPA: PQQ-binding-like beta-propeller repeat protein [Caldisericia bacterium]|nr:PQQ-binding-like beta-propeller repeat protein [Caldisericia bacterium]HOG70676.1 PQQ-binding-like beta-propeller repeat protein [Caldisericia bacterium]HPA66188.1 PQQ-binding-like beta-propeller repeat protein [Caldisericia bacterium]HPM44710.1 PQQ-binding-like beta-propeller repeat protein [Caldisericia bacterium]HPV86467.1 PQQ-binding-like beta-propeller repeat protein [Caldisericia bacterium]
MRNKVLAFLISFCVLFTMVPFSGNAKSVTPKSWPQYACDSAHSSVAADVWDYDKYDSEAWNFTMRGAKGWSRNPVVDQGKLVIGDADNTYCIDVSSGKALWTKSMDDEVASSCAISGDMVLVPTKSNLVGLSFANGDVKWKSPVTGQNISSPTVMVDEKGSNWLYLTSSQVSGLAYKFNLDLKAEVWRHQTDSACVGGTAINVDTGRVGVAAHNKIDLVGDADGKTTDSFAIQAQTFASTVAFKKYCVFTMQTGEVIVLPKPSQVSNTKILQMGGVTNYPPAVDGDTLILGSEAGRLVKFDETGTIIWDKTMPGPITAGCTVMGEVVLVPVGSLDNQSTSGIYIIKAGTGEIIKSIPLDAKYVFQPIVAWNRLFVEYGDNIDFKKRILSCYGRPPDPVDVPQIRMENNNFTAEVPYKSSIYKLVNIYNTGKTDLMMTFSSDPFLSTTINQVSLRPGERFTLTILVSAGNNKPGSYTGQITVTNTDSKLGSQQLGIITASITIKEKPPEPQLSLDNNYFNVELPYGGTVYESVSLYNCGQTQLDLHFSSDPFLSPNVSRISLRPGQHYDLNVLVNAGSQNPGKYHGLLNVINNDPNYGEKQLGLISADITVRQQDVPPYPPYNTQATWASDHVRISWSAPQRSPTEIIGYIIYRYVNTLTDSGSPTGPQVTRYSYDDYSVQHGMTYAYYVVAVGRNGKYSDPSNVVTVTIPINLPPVRNLTARVMGFGNAQVVLSWEYDQSAMFRIELNGMVIGTTMDNSFTDHNPGPTKLRYTVYPTQSGTTGPGSSVEVDLTPAPVELGPINNLTARVMGLGSASVVLTWQYSSRDNSRVGFRIELNGMTIGTTYDNSFTDHNPPKERNVYTVYAFKDSRTGPPSDVVVDLSGGGGEPPPGGEFPMSRRPTYPYWI